MKTPYELVIGRKPNISYFRVFRCKCFIFKKRKHLGKFESRVHEDMLVGYASNSKAYRVFNNSTRVIEETCDVEFDESNGSQGDLELRSIQDVGYYAPRGPNLSKLCATCLFLRVTNLGKATFIYFGYCP
jgi:hypothetical protein